jgi:putative ATPase
MSEILGAPLAERIRPQDFNEFVGQHKILSENTLLRKSIESDKIPSLIFWGPPGCGKTSLAHLIRFKTKAHFEYLSAVSAGIKDVKDAISTALVRSTGLFAQKTILFIDEIHRFNKTQQDALLQAVENGTITLIGATTENPGFEVNSALLSRCQLILFSPHTPEDLKKLVYTASQTHPRGLLKKNLVWDEAVLDKLTAQTPFRHCTNPFAVPTFRPHSIGLTACFRPEKIHAIYAEG